MMRDTRYATEKCIPGTFQFTGSEEARIERIFVKRLGQEEIRFSWWKRGKMLPRPLDLTERDLLALLRDAVAQGVFSKRFKSSLKRLL